MLGAGRAAIEAYRAYDESEAGPRNDVARDFHRTHLFKPAGEFGVPLKRFCDAHVDFPLFHIALDDVALNEIRIAFLVTSPGFMANAAS